uniref:Uncharacterized protein MANES_18G121600 n=2 Tax=Rhizophora mucronata TaxID=61149 RepID=A0A2P2LMB6_RHIMU
MFSNEISNAVLSNALRARGVLRSVLHEYNKSIAEAEDNLAQAFCLVGDLKSARLHCKASIAILEKLYGPDHIVIAHELVKLSTILLCMDDRTAVDIINRLYLLFQQHYTSDACLIFPYLKALEGEACKVIH